MSLNAIPARSACLSESSCHDSARLVSELELNGFIISWEKEKETPQCEREDIFSGPGVFGDSDLVLRWSLGFGLNRVEVESPQKDRNELNCK